MTAVQHRKEAKSQRILDAALQVFARDGYAAAAMDDIALLAHVSKPTLYMYFGSKEKLFEAMMVSRRDAMLEPFEASSRGLVEDLHRFAWAYANTVMKPEFLSLARLIIGEAQRFPAIGKAYQEAGPDRVLKGMMAYLQSQQKLGHLQFEDVELAAQDLWALILSAPRNQALHRPDDVPDHHSIARYVHNGLSVFLRAYSTDALSDITTLKRLQKATYMGTP
jgi:TetR/AcrR family transcriptional regulator, mexJK operon transcriptional repressor